MKSRLISLSRERPFVFGAIMVLSMLLMKIPFAPIVIALGGPGTTEPVLKAGMAAVVVGFACLPLETLVGQALPLWILARCGVSRWRTLCLASAGFFGLLHLVAGPGAFFIGFAGGLALSFSWLAWRQLSFMKALWRTTLVHAVHNAVAILVFLVTHALSP